MSIRLRLIPKCHACARRIKVEVDDSRQISLKSIDCLDAASTRAYIPDPPSSLDFPEIPVNKSRTQISGYLFYRRWVKQLLCLSELGRFCFCLCIFA